MSYILDALRRAQGEREAQPLTPQISTEEGQPVLRMRGPLTQQQRAALAGGAILVLILVVWLLWPASKPSPEPAAAPAAAPVTAAAAPAPPPAPVHQPSISSMDELAPSDGGMPAPAVFNEVPPMADAEQIEPAEPQKPETPAPVEQPEEPAPTTSSRTVQLEPSPSPAVKTLRDMPEDFRSAFPRFKIEVHVYDDDPASRFVLIDGTRYKEGMALGSGPLISEITADGVVFSFRNSEVLVKAAE